MKRNVLICSMSAPDFSMFGNACAWDLQLAEPVGCFIDLALVGSEKIGNYLVAGNYDFSDLEGWLCRVIDDWFVFEEDGRLLVRFVLGAVVPCEEFFPWFGVGFLRFY